MTESDWLACRTPRRMLYGLSDRLGHRKLRLYACACCYRIWAELQEVERTAVQLAEQYCDGRGVSKSRLKNASRAVERFPNGGLGLDTLRYAAANAAKQAASVVASDPHGAYSWEKAAEVASFAGRAEGALGPMDPGAGNEIPLYADLLRDIFGNPFRPVAVDPRWLTSTATTLAETIYADRSFDRLPILADALQDAGCEDEQVLAHCRGPGPHVRGCWVVDLVTGRG